MAYRVNGLGRAHANALVASGKIDKNGSWSFSAEDGNALLGANSDDWANYSKFHLGIDTAQPNDTKGHYKYPYSKNGKVCRAALVAAKQQNDPEIAAAATAILEKIDKETDTTNSKIVHLFADTKKVTGIYRMSTKGDDAEIVLYGPVGQSFWNDGVTLEQFQKDLRALGKVNKIDLRINSDGGDVFEGRAMYSLLADHPARIIVHVDGLAASIASLIAMAGDEIHMADGAFMMIHNPWGGVIGDSKQMRRMADLLDSVASTIINTYAVRTKNSKEKITELMNQETWLPAAEAKALGFADLVAEPVKAAACLSRPEIFKNLPAALRPNRTLALKAMNRIAGFLPPKSAA